MKSAMHRWAAAGLLALVAGAVARADAIRGGFTLSGDITFLDPPPLDVTANSLESDATQYFFREQERTLPTDLIANIVSPGVYNSPLDLENAPIPAGTPVRTYFVHADNENSDLGLPALYSTITFATPVIGIISETDDLTDSDPILGAHGTVYTTGTLADADRGAELLECPIELSADRLTVTICTRTLFDRDQLRIMTEIPEPASAVLLAAGALALLRRSRGSKC